MSVSSNAQDNAGTTDAPPRKRGRKKRKLNNIGCDSDGTNSESLDTASGVDDQQENGDLHMDSIRMTDDYKIISKLRERVCHKIFASNNFQFSLPIYTFFHNKTVYKQPST